MLSVPFAVVGRVWLMWRSTTTFRWRWASLHWPDGGRKSTTVGAVERVRPKMITVTAIMVGLLPIMWGTGIGSEVTSRIGVPMVGDMLSSTVLTLAVIPAIYSLVKQWRLKRGIEASL